LVVVEEDAQVHRGGYTELCVPHNPVYLKTPKEGKEAFGFSSCDHYISLELG